MELAKFQAQIERIFGEQDRARGPAASYLWFVEEVGELAEEVRHAIHVPGKATEAQMQRLHHEFGDVLAWLCTLASMLDVDMERAAARYGAGCPRCGGTPCRCAAPSAPGETGA